MQMCQLKLKLRVTLRFIMNKVKLCLIKTEIIKPLCQYLFGNHLLFLCIIVAILAFCLWEHIDLYYI